MSGRICPHVSAQGFTSAGSRRRNVAVVLMAGSKVIKHRSQDDSESGRAFHHNGPGMIVRGRNEVASAPFDRLLERHSPNGKKAMELVLGMARCRETGLQQRIEGSNRTIDG